MAEALITGLGGGSPAGFFTAICTTAKNTAAKTISVDGVTELVTGMVFQVQFGTGNSCDSYTLNVNGIGAKTVNKGGKTDKYALLCYDGTAFNCIGSDWIISQMYANKTYANGVQEIHGTYGCYPENVSSTQVGSLHKVEVTRDFSWLGISGIIWAEFKLMDYDTSPANAWVDTRWYIGNEVKITIWAPQAFTVTQNTAFNYWVICV